MQIVRRFEVHANDWDMIFGAIITYCRWLVFRDVHLFGAIVPLFTMSFEKRRMHQCGEEDTNMFRNVDGNEILFSIDPLAVDLISCLCTLRIYN